MTTPCKIGPCTIEIRHDNGKLKARRHYVNRIKHAIQVWVRTKFRNVSFNVKQDFLQDLLVDFHIGFNINSF